MKDLYNLQAGQQLHDFGIDPSMMTDAQRSELMDELVLCLHEEVSELARAVRSKPHVAQERPSVGNTLDGLADVFKLAFCIAHAADVDYAQLEAAIIAKTNAVRAKRLQFLTKMSEDVTVFVTDLDGCVADIRPFISDVQGGAYGHTTGSLAIEQRKAEWYEAGGFATLPVIEGAKDALLRIRAAGHKIAIITARPSWIHRRVAWDTQLWLKENGIPYDILSFGKDKHDELVKHVYPARVIAFVDDRDKHCYELAAYGINVLMYGTEWNTHVPDSKNITRVGGWDDIAAMVL